MSSRANQTGVSGGHLARGAAPHRLPRLSHDVDITKTKIYPIKQPPGLCCHVTVLAKLLQLVLIWTIYKGGLRFVPGTEHHRIALPSFLIDPSRRITKSSTPVDAEERRSTIYNGDQLV